MNRHDDRLTLVDLFCGAGGLSLGFRKAGFEILAAIDAWKPAVDTYARNLGKHVRQELISRGTVIPAASVVAGGPPCQGFSSAGRRREDDARNSLVRVFAEAVSRVRPAAFVFENVEGFLTGAGGRFVFDLLEPLIEAGYRVHLRKVNAANYGVPQHRKRVIAIGGLGWNPTFPEATYSAHGAPGARLGGRGLPVAPSLREAIGGLPSPEIEAPFRPTEHNPQLLDGADLERAKLLKPGQRMKDLPERLWHESYRRRAFRRVMDGTPTERRGGAPAGLRRLHPDEPSKAITSGALRDFLHPSEHRALTLRECARLQTFPDDWEFLGSKAEKSLLIGNAVPPRLAEHFARSLALDLAKLRESFGRADGTLLSFIPTLSAGMSPILEAVAARVLRRFRPKAPEDCQMTLWD